MSLWRACSDAFFHVGKLIRDLDARLKEVEKRTAILYPNSAQETTYANVKNTTINRADGTKAMTITHYIGGNPNNYTGDINMVLQKTRITVFGLDGTTIVQQYDLNPTATSFGLIYSLSI